jgi:hypothetical protein
VRLQLILTAIDGLTRPLARAQAAVRGLAAPVQALNGATRELGRASGVDRLARGLGAVAARGREALGVVTSLSARATGLGAAAAAVAGIASVGGFNRSFIRPAAEMERMRLTLETVTGSAARAQAALDWVSDFARRTPYELDEVTRGFVDITNLGIDPTLGGLEAAGNAAAIMGTRFSEATTALAAALRGEFDPLERFGVFARVDGDRVVMEWEANGRRMRAVADKTNRALIAQFIQRAWSDKYAGGMERMAEGWDGMLSNLSDAWSRFTLLVMNAGVFDFLKDQLRELLAWIERMGADGSLQRWAQEMATGLIAAGTAVRDLVVGTAEAPSLLTRLSGILSAIRDVLSPLTERFGGLETALGLVGLVVAGPVLSAMASLTAAVVTLGAALLTTPVGWFLAGAAAIGAAAYLIYANWDGISDFFAQLWSGVLFVVRTYAGHIRSLFDALWTGIQEAFEWGRQQIQPVLDWLRDATAPLRAAWEPIGAFFGGLLGGLGGAFDAAWQRIEPVVRALQDAARWLGLTGEQRGPAAGAPIGQVNRRFRQNQVRRIDGFDEPDEDGAGGPGAGPFGLPPGGVPAPAPSSGEAARLNAGVELDITVRDDRVDVRSRSSDPAVTLDVRRGLSQVPR